MGVLDPLFDLAGNPDQQLADQMAQSMADINNYIQSMDDYQQGALGYNNILYQNPENTGYSNEDPILLNVLGLDGTEKGLTWNPTLGYPEDYKPTMSREEFGETVEKVGEGIHPDYTSVSEFYYKNQDLASYWVANRSVNPNASPGINTQNMDPGDRFLYLADLEAREEARIAAGPAVGSDSARVNNFGGMYGAFGQVDQNQLAQGYVEPGRNLLPYADPVLTEDGLVITNPFEASINPLDIITYDPETELYENYDGVDISGDTDDSFIFSEISNDSNIDFTENGESGTGGTGGTDGTDGTGGTGGTGGTVSNSNDPDPTINIDGSLYDYDGNYVGSDPDLVNINGQLYDKNGNYVGAANPDPTGEIIGGASPTNPVFDEITAEQQAEIDRNAEAVELLDSGYGRYNAGLRKMGIIGRQGEEYAPLILDQLRMAEMEAAQPQFAAFGFGQNDMLGGMPQIGVQGVQGNVGGQSALSALSNAGLNQLNVGRQNYNRIALPDVGADGMPISQINNPTIFKASTNV